MHIAKSAAAIDRSSDRARMSAPDICKPPDRQSQQTVVKAHRNACSASSSFQSDYAAPSHNGLLSNLPILPSPSYNNWTFEARNVCCAAASSSCCTACEDKSAILEYGLAGSLVAGKTHVDHSEGEKLDLRPPCCVYIGRPDLPADTTLLSFSTLKHCNNPTECSKQRMQT